MSRARFAARAVAIGSIGPLDFDLAAGACLGLSGPSGAGKTRLLRALADLDSHHGAVYLDGRLATDFDAPDWRRQVMLLAAEPVWWTATVGEHFPLGDNGLSGWLARLCLDRALLTRVPTVLSSGQRQRLALLRMLVRRPRVLLLDEPTASLDAANAGRVEALIGDYCREHAACCVWVGHDRAQLARVAHRQLTLDARGQVQA